MLRVGLLLLFIPFLWGSVPAQDDLKAPKVDADLQKAFSHLVNGEYPLARKALESALATVSVDQSSSRWLFTKFQLPDENPGDADSTNAQTRQITGYRHAMGTRQAILMFLCLVSELQGDHVAAEKYSDAVYNLRSVVWGMSWKMFIPPVEALFNQNVPETKTEAYGRYLYEAGLFLDSAEEEIALKFFQKAQELVPKDPEIAANLASYYVVRLKAKEAKPLAELSLSLKPRDPHVLLDLASAEILLGELDKAAKHSLEAESIDATLPGTQASLTLISIAKNDFPAAYKYGQEGVKRSNRHPVYLSLQAIAAEAMGNHVEANALVKEAWKGRFPQDADLPFWYLTGKSLDLMKTILRRQSGN
jgi:tetratricopeptide (TPR) repeat protein